MQILPEIAMQGSSVNITATFSVTPTSITWSLYDLDERTVNGRYQVSVAAASSISIWLTDEDLQMRDEDEDYEYRKIVIEAVHADGTIKDEGRFSLRSLKSDSRIIAVDFITPNYSLLGFPGSEIDALTFFQPHIDAGTLDIVRWIDPATGVTKELYYAAFPTPGWANEIGKLKLGEGYLVITNARTFGPVISDAQKGRVTHDLRSGISFVGYIDDEVIDAQDAFQELIDAGVLTTVTWVEPETGGAKQIYYSLFPTPRWVNEIGDLQRGQGYVVNLNAPYTGFVL